MLSSIWTTVNNFINTLLGICEFVIVFGFIVCVAYMTVPAIYKAITGKDLAINMPTLIRVSVIKNKKGKNRIIFLDKIDAATLEKHEWKVVENSISILAAISIVFADME